MEKRKKRQMEITRRPFQGVLNILDFNRHFYIYGIAALLALLGIAFFLQIPKLLILLLLIGFAYGLLMPLIVSAYVYDFSNYYKMAWLDDYIKDKSRPFKVVNINAGFDETSFLVQNKLPNAQIQVYDFYDADQHTEKAIVRARRVTQEFPNTKQIATNSILDENNSKDIIFLLSSAHEIRAYDEKVKFLKECHRICKSDGRVIMVEHLRDIPNFLAFTIGFNHFFSKKVWRNAFKDSGFSKIDEKKFTPFMSIFDCKP